MYHGNGTYGGPPAKQTPAQTPGQAPPPSISNGMNTPNNQSQTSLRYQQLDGMQFDGTQFSQQGPQYAQNAIRHPIPFLPGGDSMNAYGGGDPQRDHVPNNAAASSNSWEGDARPPMPYGQPTLVNPNMHGGQTGEAGANFAGYPPIFPPILPPEIPARPNAQGVYSATWKLWHCFLHEVSGDEVRVIIQFKRM
ncbi:hypothetical protein BC826DRAFT_308067 [Russula brevipes]|nr:hypothetical protein BC826DRAFT_308067 [Russula brevipes]